MANLNIAYWQGVAVTPTNTTAFGEALAQVPTNLVGSDSVAISASSAATVSSAPTCGIIQLNAEADCYVSFGSAPDASTGTRLALFAGVPQFIGRPASPASLKIATIQRAVA